MGLLDLFSSDLNTTPPENRLDQAIIDLGKYYAVEGKNVALAPDEESTEEEEEPIDNGELDLDLLQKIRSMVLDTSERGKHAVDILRDETLLAKSDEVSKYLWIRCEQGWGDPKLNTTDILDDGEGLMSLCASLKKPATTESKTDVPRTDEIATPTFGNTSADPEALTNPHLSAIMINHPMIHPSRNRSVAGSIFFNAIPGIEMSQCSPFIRIAFKSDFETAVGMTLFGFADGNLVNSKNDTEGGINFQDFRMDYKDNSIGSQVEGSIGGVGGAIASALGLGGDEIVVVDRESTYGSGIELFQSPQTLNGLGGALQKEDKGIFSTSEPKPSTHRQLNPAAPIATLKSLSVSIAGLGIATLANKTASMDFVIHDRSFMRFLSPLIGGQQFGGTSVLIEFGWMHPQATDTSEGNVYANFLNSLRSRSEYNIQVANTSLGNDGQVNVSLKLASRGVSEAVSAPAGAGVTHVSADAVAPVFSRITRSLLNASVDQELGEQERLADIRQSLRAVGSFKGPANLISIEDYTALLNQIKQSAITKNDTAAIKAAVEIMNKIMEAKKDPDNTKNFTSLGDGLEAKRLRLETVDLFSEGDGKNTPLTTQVREQEANTEGEEGDSTANSENADTKVGSSFPTLGSVITTYVGRPLQALGKFDEVQLIFYPFNTQAGSMHEYNIASFTLDEFPAFIQKMQLESPSISVHTFLEKLLGSKYAGGPGNPAHTNYGLSTYYADKKKITDGAQSDEDKKLALTGLASTKVDRLCEIYSNPLKLPEFEVPDITVTMETVPAEFKPKEGEVRKTSILRIHVYDAKGGMRNDTNLINQLNIAPVMTCTSSENEQPKPVSQQNAVQASEARSPRSEDIIVAQSKGKDDKNRDLTLLYASLPMKKIKAALKTVHPSITFGTQFTNIKSVTVSSNTSGATNQVLLVNAVKLNRSGNASNQSSDLEDVFVIPASVNMQVEGFPLVEYAQKYFIDFGTGTTMDNFYYVTGINHTISPGSFTTQIQLSYNGSATRKSIIGELTRAASISG